MKVSHILYKANNLAEAVEKFQNQGFTVEYGSKSNPHNALIYFSNGPYIEILEKAAIPFFARIFLRLTGKNYVVERLDNWAHASEGFFEICLENYEDDFLEEEKLLNWYEQSYFITRSKRTDPKNRTLKWKLLFPKEIELPFLMTYFNIDPKPKNYTHPNGVSRISKVEYGSNNDHTPIIQGLCDDELLILTENAGEVKISFDKEL